MKARVKRAASDIAQLAYDESSDDDQVNDQAEQLMYLFTGSWPDFAVTPVGLSIANKCY